MGTCYDCGGEITFRYIGGVCTPIHRSGGCYPSSSSTTLTSFVDPNARCPVCGDRVFFYRSPYNGRVFFDELGPPWPKHPCTDNTFEHFPLNLSTASAPETGIVRLKAEWQRSGWRPFRCRKTEYKEDKNMTAVFGKAEGESGEWTLFVGGEVRDMRDYPTLVRPKGKSKSDYEIATFRLEDKKRSLKKLRFDAYLPTKYRSPTVAPRRTPRRKRQT